MSKNPFEGLTGGELLIVILFLIAIALGVFAFTTAIVTWAWNFVAPLFWKAAPVLTFWTTAAVLILIGVIKGIIQIKVHKSE